jgi:hypothetical protein
MKRDGGAGWNRDAGLSEVVGFVLIIAVLMAVFSLYLTYGVPAQGRENEILHMGVVKDQFISYKIGLDSLATNNKVDTTLSNSFSLGSEGGYTQGGVMGFIPIMNPVSSGGTFSINRRTTEPETLNISSLSLILDTTLRDRTELPAGVQTSIQNRPQNLYVNITGIQNVDCAYGVEVNGTEWKATVNVTPRQIVVPEIITQSSSSCPSGTYLTGFYDPAGPGVSYYCMNPSGSSRYNGTDISVTVFKGSTTSLQDIPVFRNISSGRIYTVDLMDQAYGLDSVMNYPDTITLSNTYAGKNSATITGSGNATYGYREKSFVSGPIPLGSIEYQSQNHYWIFQEYYYQMGGVFLSQIDGNNTYKLPPEISFALDNSDPNWPVTRVIINAVSITNPYGGSAVGGNSPVQIKTTLDSVYDLPYATGKANTKWIRIAVNTTDEQARGMWKNYFDYTATVAGIPHTETGIAGTESYILIRGSHLSDSDGYDINVVASNATYTAMVNGVGG